MPVRLNGSGQSLSLGACRSSITCCTSAHSSDCGHRLLRPLSSCVLDVRIARPPAISVQPASGRGIQPVLGLVGLGARGSGALPGLPVVRKSEAAPQRYMAQLSLSLNSEVEPTQNTLCHGF